MRIFEIFLIIGLLFSALGILFIKNKKLRIVLPTLSMTFSFASIFVEGFRFVMVPAYSMSVIIFALSLTKLFLMTKKRHPILKGLEIAAFCLFYMLSIALPSFLPVINLTKPNGPNPVGTMRMAFNENNRKNVLTGKTSSQKIAVQVWYPASSLSGAKQANWIDKREVASLFAKSKGLPDLFGQLCLIKTNSYWNAGLSNETNKFPIILFSGGGGMFNGSNTIQMEELASEGYVVFAVSHPYDDFASVYPEGDIVPYSSKLSAALSKDSARAIDIAKKQITDDRSPEFQRVIIRNCKLYTENVRVWSDDMSFVADQISKLNDGSIKSIFAGRLDTVKMGLFGHSFGGAALGQTCLRDSRFKAFINMDGTPFGDTVDTIIQQPFMILTIRPDKNSKRVSVSDGYSENQKNFLVVSINGTEHMNFTDLNTVIPNAGKALGALGSISANRQTEITNTYIVSFFNKYLKEMPEPLLNALASQYPEVTIEKK
ncbi:MAG: alpha/beta hydrolase family protein [Clostridium sp.]|uniref:alpha/beta hydrolase family protein n=1 Tax=Clostridium sp. TaxID=1506 RepID=UPI003D6D545D